jgi:hypothetical protein
MMDDQQEYIQRLRAIIRQRHGSDSEHVRSVPVREKSKDKVVWEGTVEAFRLIDCPKTNRCFAWIVQNGDQEEVVTVLGIPPVIGPATAVQSYAELRRQGQHVSPK